jgi:hypothetical protein
VFNIEGAADGGPGREGNDVGGDGVGRVDPPRTSIPSMINVFQLRLPSFQPGLNLETAEAKCKVMIQEIVNPDKDPPDTFGVTQFPRT